MGGGFGAGAAPTPFTWFKVGHGEVALRGRQIAVASSRLPGDPAALDRLSKVPLPGKLDQKRRPHLYDPPQAEKAHIPRILVQLKGCLKAPRRR